MMTQLIVMLLTNSLGAMRMVEINRDSKVFLDLLAKVADFGPVETVRIEGFGLTNAPSKGGWAVYRDVPNAVYADDTTIYPYDKMYEAVVDFFARVCRKRFSVSRKSAALFYAKPFGYVWSGLVWLMTP